MQNARVPNLGQSITGDNMVAVKILGQREIQIFDLIFLAREDLDKSPTPALIESLFGHEAGSGRCEEGCAPRQRIETFVEVRWALGLERRRK